MGRLAWVTQVAHEPWTMKNLPQPQSERYTDGRSVTLLALKIKGPQAKECGQHLESGKGKEMNSSLEPAEKNTALPTS